MAGTILVMVEDLIFLSKIRDAAQQVGVSLEVLDPKTFEERLAEIPARAVILDLNHRSGAALQAVRTIKSAPSRCPIPVVGFVSHVQSDLILAARQAGCDQVLARSAFSSKLPRLLEKLAGKGAASTRGA